MNRAPCVSPLNITHNLETGPAMAKKDMAKSEKKKNTPPTKKRLTPRDPEPVSRRVWVILMSRMESVSEKPQPRGNGGYGSDTRTSDVLGSTQGFGKGPLL